MEKTLELLTDGVSYLESNLSYLKSSIDIAKNEQIYDEMCSKIDTLTDKISEVSALEESHIIYTGILGLLRRLLSLCRELIKYQNTINGETNTMSNGRNELVKTEENKKALRLKNDYKTAA